MTDNSNETLDYHNDLDESIDEPILYDYCPKCNYHYDGIEHEFQICSRCWWDAEKGKYTR